MCCIFVIISHIRFWARATREGVPIVNYWDRRIRKLLKTRYDYREGVFDFDYYMILKPRCITNLTIQEYRYVYVCRKHTVKIYKFVIEIEIYYFR